MSGDAFDAATTVSENSEQPRGGQQHGEKVDTDTVGGLPWRVYQLVRMRLPSRSPEGSRRATMFAPNRKSVGVLENGDAWNVAVYRRSQPWDMQNAHGLAYGARHSIHTPSIVLGCHQNTQGVQETSRCRETMRGSPGEWQE